MSYEYDSKINRELAKTALEIYTKSHSPEPQAQLNESTENLNEEILSSHINGLLLEYVADVVVLAEQELNIQLNEQQVEIFAQYIIENIDGLGEEGRMRMISELAHTYGA
jgi:hypothetical protein|tara:strand:+ start:1676 stop:2005 length:330 start_codon:yes stop_codon:yes gene_type:complete